MTTGEYMKAARKNAKLTRGKLSEISGVSLQSIYNCEHDIQPDIVYCDVLGRCIEDID